LCRAELQVGQQPDERTRTVSFLINIYFIYYIIVVLEGLMKVKETTLLISGVPMKRRID
jgi:hypothetical protein